MEMNRALLRRAAALVATLSVTACASIGAPFDENRLADLRPGVTTADDAAAILGGKPK
jgi:hypothetical protein